MTYLEVIKYLDSFINYEKKTEYPYKESLKLERIRDFLEILGNPQDSFKSIHVAGTKGKGSVCAFVAYILKEAGYKTGLYTSPHLSDVRERIRVLTPLKNYSLIKPCGAFEGMIPSEDLVALAERLRHSIDDYCKISAYGPLSFFEVYTALAFVYFKEQRVDFAVLETGLGGRLDATNVVKASVSAITSISYDHTNKLGSTLTEIATEKAGIIKDKKSIVISAPQEDEVIAVLRESCRHNDASLFEIGRQITFDRQQCSFDSQTFNIAGSLGQYSDLKIRLAGSHQVVNAAVAVGIVGGLNKLLRLEIKEAAIKGGLYETFWPARFETVSEAPLIILDGAHNGASAKALKDTVSENLHGKKIIMILGISRDKDVDAICRELVPISSRIVLTCADNPRALKPAEILAKVFLYNPSAFVRKTKSVREALLAAMELIDEESVIMVTGSLFVVGEARDFILENKNTIESASQARSLKV